MRREKVAIPTTAQLKAMGDAFLRAKSALRHVVGALEDVRGETPADTRLIESARSEAREALEELS